MTGDGDGDIGHRSLLLLRGMTCESVGLTVGKLTGVIVNSGLWPDNTVQPVSATFTGRGRTPPIGFLRQTRPLHAGDGPGRVGRA